MTNVSKVYFSFSLVCDGFGGAGVAPAGVRRPDLGDGGERVGLLVALVVQRVQIVDVTQVGAEGAVEADRRHRTELLAALLDQTAVAEVRTGREPFAAVQRAAAGRRRSCGRGGERTDGLLLADRDGQADLQIEVSGQRGGDRLAQDALDGFLGEVGRRGEQRGGAEQPDRLGEGEPGPLLLAQCRRQIRHDVPPHRRQSVVRILDDHSVFPLAPMRPPSAVHRSYPQMWTSGERQRPAPPRSRGAAE